MDKWKLIELGEMIKIEKCVGKYQISMHTVLPYGKMKIKIYEDQESLFSGRTDVCVKRKFDGETECAVGFGKTEAEALEDTIKHFLNMIQEDYPKEKHPNGLAEEDIEYADYFDF